MNKPIFITILLFIFFTSCKKDKVYLTDEQRSLLLYDVGDQFTLVKNETDTLNFTVTKKEFNFGDDYNGLFKTGTYYEYGNIEYKNENSISEIRVTSMINRFETYWHYFKENNQLINFNSYKKYIAFTINNKQYNNVYLLTSYGNDTMFVSTDVGILYIKSHEGDEYKLIEQ